MPSEWGRLKIEKEKVDVSDDESKCCFDDDGNYIGGCNRDDCEDCSNLKRYEETGGREESDGSFYDSESDSDFESEYDSLLTSPPPP